MVVRTRLTWILLALIVAAACLLTLVQFEPTPEAGVSPGAMPSLDTAQQAHHSDAKSSPSSKASRQLAPPPTTAAVFIVRGRCLMAENGQPLGGASAALMFDESGPDGEVLASVESAFDGTFACVMSLPAPAVVQLHVKSAQRATVSGQFDGANGLVWDVGEILIPTTARVVGEVIDTTGEPVAEASVWFVKSFVDRKHMAIRTTHRATSDGRGLFSITEPIAGGEWHLSVDATGALRDPRKTQVPATGVHHVRIEVERPDPEQAILGTVVDVQGLPLGGIELAAAGEGSAARAVSRVDGTFTLHRGPPRWDTGKPGVLLTAVANSREQASGATGQRVAWGQRRVVVVMQPLATVVVRAVYAQGGAVTGFDVLHARLTNGGETMTDYAPATVQRRDDGAVLLTSLRTGDHVLLLRPHDAGLAAAGPVPFSVGDGHSSELLVTVHDRSELQVQVVDRAERPVANCELSLLLGMTKAAVEPALPAPLLEALRSVGLRGQRQVAVAAGRTNAQGLLQLAVPLGHFWLLARSARHLPSNNEIDVVGSKHRQRIVLDSASRLLGQLSPASVLSALRSDARNTKDNLWATMQLTVIARREDAVAIQSRAAAARIEIARAEVDEHGAFVLGPLPSGRIGLRLLAWMQCSDVHTAVMHYSLGEVECDGTGDLQREFVVDELLPAAAQGVVVLDGELVRDGQFFLRRVEPTPTLGVRIATDDQGRFDTRLPPGVYEPQLAIPAQPGPGHVMLPLLNRCTIAPGATAQLRIEGHARRLRLRVLNSDGLPLANRRVRTENRGGYNRPGVLRTDPNGIVELQPAPNGVFFLFVPQDNGPELRIGPLELPVGHGPAELEYRFGG